MLAAQGSDAKDALLGRIFGYSAFSQAGRAADNATAARLVASLISVMGRKSFLREAAANALVACLGQPASGNPAARPQQQRASFRLCSAGSAK